MDSPSPAVPRDPRAGRRLEAIVLAVAFVVVNLVAATLQKPISFNGGEGWEGVAYYAVADQFSRGQHPVEAAAPEVYRVGGPFLASLVRRATGLDLFSCFRIVNGTANALTLALLVVWLRRFVADWRVRTALGLAFVLQWDTPTRWMYFFPAHTDPWMWVFLLGGLIAVERYRERPGRGRLAVVAVLVAVGVCFREVVLVVACIVPFVGEPLRLANLRTVAAGRWPAVRHRVLPSLWRRAIPLAAGLLAMLAVRRFAAHQDNTYSFALTALHWFYEKPWVTYVHAWFLAFGPLLWLAILRPRQSAAFFVEHQHLAAYALAFAVLGDIGGTDTERLLFWSMPVVYLLIGRALEDRRPDLPAWLLTVIFAAQALAQRAVFWPIPDYPTDAGHVWPLFTPLGRQVPFLDLYSFWETRLLALTSLLTYLAFGTVLAAWFVWRRFGGGGETPGQPEAAGAAAAFAPSAHGTAVYPAADE